MLRGVVIACLVLLSHGSLLYSQTQPWHETIDFHAGLRLRYDATKRDDFQDVFRYRLRAGLEVAVHDAIRAGLEIRSGDPRNPVTDNQSFGGGLSKHEFSIAEAFAEFRLSPRFSAVAGKFGHPGYWVVSDMQWDSDVTLEGFLERLEVSVSDGVLTGFGASLYQLILEQSGEGDAWLLGAQIRPVFQIGAQNVVTAGVGFDYFVDPQKVVDLTLSGNLTGNRVTNLLDDSGMLISDFRIVTTFVNWRNDSIRPWPLSLSFFLYKNTGAKDAVGTEIGTGSQGRGKDNDTAFFVRVAAGQGRELGRLRLRFTYYYSEPDAILYAFMQSDTGAASNLNGIRFDLRIGMPGRTHFDVTWYHTQPKLGEVTTMNRWLIDYVLGF